MPIKKRLGTFSERLKKELSYCPVTGEFRWLVNKRGGVKAGQLAGHYTVKGYLRIKFEGRIYEAGRLAWFMVYGVWPTNIIDHRNQNPRDTRFSNLRDVTYQENALNIKQASSRNLSGYRGVRFIKHTGKYQAKFRDTALGCYDTPKQAYAAYLTGRERILQHGP
jgi:hypothetical protein